MGVKQLVRIWWWVCTVVVLAVSAWMWWSLASDGWATAFNTAGAAAVQTGGNPTSDDGQQVALIDISVFVTVVTLFTVGIVVQNRDIPTDGLRRRLTDGRGLLVGGRLSGTVLYIAVIVIAMHIRTIFAVTTSLQGIPAPSERAVVDGAYLVSDGFQSVTAGLWEEICLFAVPIALLSMRKRSGVGADQAPEVLWRWGPVRWTLILITVLVLRSGIHLYYGWGGVFVVPWMIGAVLLYRALRSIWPLVIGHIIYDILVDLSNRLPLLNDVIALALWGFVVAGVLIVVLSIIRRRQRVQALPGSPISGDDRPPAAPTSESLHG